MRYLFVCRVEYYCSGHIFPDGRACGFFVGFFGDVETYAGHYNLYHPLPCWKTTRLGLGISVVGFLNYF